MPKSAIEKALEKQMKQTKQLEEKRKREEQKRAREESTAARKQMMRERAASIVNGQAVICGFRIMDITAEEILKCLLEQKNEETSHVIFQDNIFPDYAQMSLDVEMEKLVQYGMIGGLIFYDNGGWCDILPPALLYFENKEKALRQQEEQKKQPYGNITNYGNLVFGNVSNSKLTVDNSIQEIERQIDAQGGEDKEELRELLEEVMELIDNIRTSHAIPKQKKLFQRINDHVVKHGWFYGAIVQLLGTVAMTMMGA